jgi:Heavy metal associated domain 2
VIAEIARPDLAAPAPSGVAMVYHHPGRIRLRGTALERSPRIAARARDAVAELDGIRRVVHNAASGSLLVEYAPGATDADEILAKVAASGLRLEDRPPMPNAPRAVVGAARGLNAQVFEATRGATDLHGAVSFALGVGAVTTFMLGRGSRWPRWDNLLYWSYTFFRDVRHRDFDRRSGRSDSR